MDLVVINIGNLPYAEYSLPYIKKLCDYNQINLHIIDRDPERNVRKAHPSWVKTIAHDIYDSDFIITWDLDLCPTKLYDLKQYFDITRLNLGYDRAYEFDNWMYNGKFKYNCGLIGIPKSYAPALKDLYDRFSAENIYPSWEQYHINDYIFDNNIEINLLPSALNCMYFEKMPEEFLNIHYTNMWLIPTEGHRCSYMEKHALKYAGAFKRSQA